MKRLLFLLILLLAGNSTWAQCPTVVADCLQTPTYNTVQALQGTISGPWTTATRPTTFTVNGIAQPLGVTVGVGLTGFNTNLGAYEAWNGTGWQSAIPSLTNLSSSGVRANQQLGNNSLPAYGYILRVLFHETAGFNVSVGIGTTPGATDVLSPQLVLANQSLTVDITAFSLGSFMPPTPQPLYLSSASWGFASINAQLDYEIGP